MYSKFSNEKASPSVAALGLAEETGAASRHTTNSKNHNTTNTAQRQIGEISQLLLCGAENAIPRRELMSLTGYSDRGLRLQIEAERRQGIPILSDNQHGYFMPGSEEERLHCVRSLRSRAAEVEATAAAIEKAVLPE